jgi:hypothetical protein
MNARALSLFSFLYASQLAVASSVDGNVRSEARQRVISHIPHKRVDSTAIAAIGYSKRRHILEIEFVNGAVYRYLDITPSTYRELMIADSKARYYDSNIRGNYPSARVRPRAKP